MALAEANMMNGHGHVEPVTRAWDARLSRIERRLAELTKSGEQRVRVLRDALAEFISDEMAERDDEIASLKKHIADLERQLEQKITIDKLVNEAVTRLDARQVARDEAKRGKTGRQGERGARGERGPPGARGPAALPAKPAPVIHSWYRSREVLRYAISG